jgi:hypothetical protein
MQAARTSEILVIMWRERFARLARSIGSIGSSTCLKH